jgi:cephalosporin-C deacetylase-like acetyl esterase
MSRDYQGKKLEDPRQMLRRLLGDFPPIEFKLAERKPLAGFPHMRVEQMRLGFPSGEMIRAILTGPLADWRSLPSVLYCHAHGNRYAMGANELIEGRPALLQKPYGQALAEQGIVALSIDMPCFGLRSHTNESELSKRLLYQGQTLFGQMLSELGAAAQFLTKLEGVDSKRMGAFGFSMGATHAFWLAALEPAVKAVAHACSFADLDHLIRSGAHDLHGLYMTVPRLLQNFSTGEIAGLIAPRPQLACVGLLDPLTPKQAVETAFKDALAAYVGLNAEQHFYALIDPDSGHRETEEMRKGVIDFFKQWL